MSMWITDSSKLNALKTFGDLFRQHTTQRFIKVHNDNFKGKENDIPEHNEEVRHLHNDIGGTRSWVTDTNMCYHIDSGKVRSDHLDYLKKFALALKNWSTKLATTLEGLYGRKAEVGNQLELKGVTILQKWPSFKLTDDSGDWNLLLNSDLDIEEMRNDSGEVFFEAASSDKFVDEKTPQVNSKTDITIVLKEPAAFDSLPEGSRLTMAS